MLLPGHPVLPLTPLLCSLPLQPLPSLSPLCHPSWAVLPLPVPSCPHHGPQRALYEGEGRQPWSAVEDTADPAGSSQPDSDLGPSGCVVPAVWVVGAFAQATWRGRHGLHPRGSAGRAEDRASGDRVNRGGPLYPGLCDVGYFSCVSPGCSRCQSCCCDE